jgi:hypothetical protein
MLGFAAILLDKIWLLEIHIGFSASFVEYWFASHVHNFASA